MDDLFRRLCLSGRLSPTQALVHPAAQTKLVSEVLGWVHVGLFGPDTVEQVLEDLAVREIAPTATCGELTIHDAASFAEPLAA